MGAEAEAGAVGAVMIPRAVGRLAPEPGPFAWAHGGLGRLL